METGNIRRSFSASVLFGTGRSHVCRAQNNGPTAWSRDLCCRFDRRSDSDIFLNVMPRQLNPICTVIGFSPSTQLKWCSMHTVNLSIALVVNGSAVQLLCERSALFAILQDLLLKAQIYSESEQTELFDQIDQAIGAKGCHLQHRSIRPLSPFGNGLPATASSAMIP